MKSSTTKKIILFLYDFCAVFLCNIFSLLLIENINDFEVLFRDSYLVYGAIIMAIALVAHIGLGLYKSLWKYASVAEALRIGIASLITFIINLIMIFSFAGNKFGISVRWAVIFAFLEAAFSIIPRFGWRFIRYLISKNDTKGERVMIVGAGDAGIGLLREIRVSSRSLEMYPVCLIDDDLNKLNTEIGGCKVVGNRQDIPHMAAKYHVDTIIVAMPAAKRESIKEILTICNDTHCKTKILPGTVNALNNTNLFKSVRNVEVTDLLGREQIKVNLDEIMGYIENRVILVTGGGGSIGSELCRQIATHSPKQLIIFDIYENNAYDIEQELKRKHPELNLLALIGSVRDKGKLDDLFNKYHPDIVFHAAAHKHVPLMETSPNEAVKNNVFGTLNCARMADKYGVKKFIQISTDKAVNPTNVMGATKRICEMIVQTIGKHSKTDFVAVRFGNVLGSNGSVIPLFKRQIENGGPVTVTHKDITRFFMTIPEAVSLVLQAGAYAHGGEIFVLDMGKPVKIYDLAVNLIKLSGYTPNVDMMIEVTGLRPGEKLYEELLMSEEGLQKTDNELIFVGKPIVLNEETLFDELDKLYEYAYKETDKMKELISELVPTYHYQK